MPYYPPKYRNQPVVSPDEYCSNIMQLNALNEKYWESHEKLQANPDSRSALEAMNEADKRERSLIDRVRKFGAVMH